MDSNDIVSERNELIVIAADNSSVGQSKETWTTEEKKWFLNEYAIYEKEIGLTKLFRTKKALYVHLSQQIKFIFGREKTEKQISNRVQTIQRQRKNAIAANYVASNFGISANVHGPQPNVHRAINGGSNFVRPFNVASPIESLFVNRSTGVVKPSSYGNHLITFPKVQPTVPRSTGPTGPISVSQMDRVETISPNIVAGTGLSTVTASVVPNIGMSSQSTALESTGDTEPTSIPNAPSAETLDGDVVYIGDLSTVFEVQTTESTSPENTVIWTNDESKYMLDQYFLYMNEIGPMKLFRKKKEMWKFVTGEINSTFKTNKTVEQVSKRYDAIIQTKKDAVNKNKVSGAVRNEVEFQKEIDKINAFDDSIEPEVVRGVNFVRYKEVKENPKPKKPRWDKPTKKGIMDVLSETLLSIEKRRLEREAEKASQRSERHNKTMELLNAIAKKNAPAP